jgi:acyl dehydratase
MKPGDQIPELRVTPDRYLPFRYAGASGDFNPIHLDPEFARSVGLPRTILHGLYCAGLIARATVDAAGGDPRRLKRLSLQFRAMAFVEQEIVIGGCVAEPGDDRTVIDLEAEQDGRSLVGAATAELRFEQG